MAKSGDPCIVDVWCVLSAEFSTFEGTRALGQQIGERLTLGTIEFRHHPLLDSLYSPAGLPHDIHPTRRKTGPENAPVFNVGFARDQAGTQQVGDNAGHGLGGDEAAAGQCCA